MKDTAYIISQFSHSSYTGESPDITNQNYLSTTRGHVTTKSRGVSKSPGGCPCGPCIPSGYSPTLLRDISIDEFVITYRPTNQGAL